MAHHITGLASNAAMAAAWSVHQIMLHMNRDCTAGTITHSYSSKRATSANLVWMRKLKWWQTRIAMAQPNQWHESFHTKWDIMMLLQWSFLFAAKVFSVAIQQYNCCVFSSSNHRQYLCSFCLIKNMIISFSWWQFAIEHKWCPRLLYKRICFVMIPN